MSISGIGASNPAWYHAGRTQRGGADNKTARISENTKQPAFADKVDQAAQAAGGKSGLSRKDVGCRR